MSLTGDKLPCIQEPFNQKLDSGLVMENIKTATFVPSSKKVVVGDSTRSSYSVRFNTNIHTLYSVYFHIQAPVFSFIAFEGNWCSFLFCDVATRKDAKDVEGDWSEEKRRVNV